MIPAVPKDKAEKIKLIEDLTRMDCKGLFTHPWSLRSENMVREFSQECSNEWEGTLRKDPKKWTAELWVEVYNFLKEGRGWAFQTDKFASSKFSALVNPKDRYIVADCENPRERRVLEYIVPIPYSKKPIQIIETISNIVFCALSSMRPVS